MNYLEFVLRWINLHLSDVITAAVSEVASVNWKGYILWKQITTKGNKYIEPGCWGLAHLGWELRTRVLRVLFDANKRKSYSKWASRWGTYLNNGVISVGKKLVNQRFFSYQSRFLKTFFYEWHKLSFYIKYDQKSATVVISYTPGYFTDIAWGLHTITSTEMIDLLK